MELILASTSPYRQELLSRFAHPFDCIAPQTDETPVANEPPLALAGRLAREKAMSVARKFPDALVIGSDQVASLDDMLLGKPGDHLTATRQLTASSGREVSFYTGVALACTAKDLLVSHIDVVQVSFRKLSGAEIDNYLRLEQPYDCAGSFKCEGLGIALFDKLTCDDPTSLQGLPLIALNKLLLASGFNVLLSY